MIAFALALLLLAEPAWAATGAGTTLPATCKVGDTFVLIGAGWNLCLVAPNGWVPVNQNGGAGQMGPAGPPGPAGPQGAQGPPGVTPTFLPYPGAGPCPRGIAALAPSGAATCVP